MVSAGPFTVTVFVVTERNPRPAESEYVMLAVPGPTTFTVVVAK